MAFDQTIEADRVDDLGLFSAFVRAPVVGTLMWIVGGSRAVEEEEKHKEQKLADGEDDRTSTSRSQQQAPRHELNMEEVNGRLKKTAPRLIGSDISEFGECAAEMESLSLQKSSLRKSSSKSLRKSRKMSWSDESGQSLCEYIEEVSYFYCENIVLFPSGIGALACGIEKDTIFVLFISLIVKVMGLHGIFSLFVHVACIRMRWRVHW